jgi:CheY-like chemotaxis protein
VSELPKILAVDDEPLLLEGLARNLRSKFLVRTATSGAAALAMLAEDSSYAVIMSDMRMPQMNGAVLLAQARALHPNVVRVLLTGQSELSDAISAVNDGNIFRFLSKPCDRPTLENALAAACEQHRLIEAEKILLEQTLRGSIKALCDTLALANPDVFGSSTRVKRLAAKIATKLHVADLWKIEVAAMVCRLGAITVPAHVFERRARRELLSSDESAMLERIPEITERLLASIPRLEEVRAIARQACANGLSDPKSMLESRILRLAFDFDDHEALRGSSPAALDAVRANAQNYDPQALLALAETLHISGEIVQVPWSALREGMVVSADVRTKTGLLLVARGHEVTAGLLGRLENFESSLESKMILVMAAAH